MHVQSPSCGQEGVQRSQESGRTGAEEHEPDYRVFQVKSGEEFGYSAARQDSKGHHLLIFLVQLQRMEELVICSRVFGELFSGEVDECKSLLHALCWE